MKIINLWRLFNMKKFKYLNLPYQLTGLIIILTLLLSFSINSFAKDKGNGNTHHEKFQKITVDPSQSIIDVGNITSWVRDDGLHFWNVASSWNGAYPNGASAGAIYSDGILWSGLVNDGQTPVLRTNGNTYQNGTAAISRLYRVRSDYLTADLSQDAADFFMENVSDVNPDQINTIKTQYQKDWNEWPTDQGAPYKDVNGDGQYDPSVDIPGVPGATQTLFIRYNDSNSQDNYECIPIGLDISETYWAYSAGTLANIIFKKVDIIYTGTSGSAPNSSIDSLYIIQWSDPDVGNSTDDFAGCDTTLNMSYAYSSGYTDAVYQGIGLAPPAAGYDFLQGASHYTGNPSDSAIFNFKWRKGYKYINPKPMSTSIYFAAGGTWSDPEFNYDGARGWFNMCRGDLPVPPYPSANPFPSAAADVTPYGTYLLDGDPVFGSGKIDGAVDGPGDRRICAINGPITLNIHDTAEVVLAMVAGLGTSNISSISVMKFNDASAQYAYDQLFNIPIMPQPIVQSFGLNDEVALNWGQPQSLLDQIENGDHGVYNFQAYSVYQLPPGGTDITKGVRIATFDLKDLTTVLYDKFLDANTGLIITKPAVVLKNEGLQRYMTITQDQIFNKPLANGLNYTFAVTAMAYNSDPNLPANILESAPYIVNVTPQNPAPGITYQPEGQLPSSDITHTGTADATLDVNVISPDNVTGHQYQVAFHNEMYSLGSDGKWTDITPPKKLGKIKDITGSSLIASAGWTEMPGVFDIHYMLDLVSPDNDWVDGIELHLPANITIDSIYKPISNNDGSEIDYTYDQSTNTIFFGDSSRSGNGLFAGGEDIMLVSHTANLPIITNYTIYDDGYGGNIVDVTSSDTISAISTVIIQKQWNVEDLTTGNIVLTNQTIYGGQDIYAPDFYYQKTGLYGPGGSSGSMTADVNTTANSIFDNSLQVAVTGSFDAPTTMGNTAQATVYVNGEKIRFSSSNAWWTDDANYTVCDFTRFGYANGTAAASDGAYGGSGGVPLTDVNLLQQDLELRWTGVLGDTTINGTTVQITKSGGQLITLFGASGYDIADSPLNPNPGSGAPFLVRVPFEVWNVDENEQVNMIFWDRSGDGSTSWNMDDREYTWVVNTEYDPTTPIDPAGSVVADSATWNVVVYLSTFTLDDVVKISYANPLQVGVDNFTFNTKELMYNNTQAKDDVRKINVFPNPYYGYQYRETSRNSHYVTFSHLPMNATIRIFDLSGVLVRTIQHVGPTGQKFDQFEQWSLQNDSGYPVASGIYIVYIDMPDIGATKILKLAVIQEQQILPVY
jgi:hypothetical protein